MWRVWSRCSNAQQWECGEKERKKTNKELLITQMQTWRLNESFVDYSTFDFCRLNDFLRR